MSTSSVAVGKIEMQLRKGQALPSKGWALGKVIIEKSRSERSLMEQVTIENVSYPNFFFNFLRRQKKNLTSFYAKNVFTVYNVFKIIFCP